jgi:hypothetical protein
MPNLSPKVKAQEGYACDGDYRGQRYKAVDGSDCASDGQGSRQETIILGSNYPTPRFTRNI